MEPIYALRPHRMPLFQQRVISAAISGLLSTGAWAVMDGPINPVDPVKPVPKYVIPLVIPPEMPKNAKTPEPCPAGVKCPETIYNIAVRQFKQQILPGGVWDALLKRNDGFGATTVWGYGSAADPIPNGLKLNGVQVQPPGVAPVPAAQSSFNYPSFTIENKSQEKNTVRWINELVALDPVTGKPYTLRDKRRTSLPHLLAVDRTLHFANPERLPCADQSGKLLPGAPTTDCRPYIDPNSPNPLLGQPYDGPVPMVVHVHGAEVNPYSDGFTEGWWLPSAFNPKSGAPLSAAYATRGSHYDQAPALRSNQYPGSAAYLYENTQPATTLWYHDHTLGMTANNVYTGPAGFWLIRGDYTATNGKQVKEQPARGRLPGSQTKFGRPTNPTMGGCDPNFDTVCRDKIREIPIALQDRSFNSDGSLFYPQTRAFFDGGNSVPYLPASDSDVSPIHNPEFFGNMIVVNGTVWPTFSVVPQRYRLRLLAGADSRTFNLSLWAIPPGAKLPDQNSPTYWSDLKATPGMKEIPFYQIGAEQGFLPKVVKVMTGTAVALPGNGTEPAAACTMGANLADPHCERGLLMAPAERPDVIVDFSGLPPGTRVHMINTGPDVPFGGFPLAAADLASQAGTGQIMEFNVVAPTAATPPDTSTPPASLVLNSEPPNTAPVSAIRRASLIEEDSKKICVTVNPAGVITVVSQSAAPQADPAKYCAGLTNNSGNLLGAIPFGPTDVFVGTMVNGIPVPQPWANPITEAPTKGDNDIWEIYNYTVDAHPMHLHGARVQVVGRQPLALDAAGAVAVPAALAVNSVASPPEPTEAGYKDIVIALPGQVTSIKPSSKSRVSMSGTATLSSTRITR